MVRRGMALMGLILPGTALAQAPVPMHATYETYAAGLHVADVESGFTFGPWTYRMRFAYHTLGVVGFFYGGHELDMSYGAWKGDAAEPSRFLGQGVWRGEQREAELDYQQGTPEVHRLIPPNDTEREPVPDTLRVHTIDSISALAQLIHVVAETGRCDTTVRTFDGRRAVEIQAHTVGMEILPQTDRSTFAGQALRCDFQGRLLAGFRHDDDRRRDGRPMHGSAWLATVVPGTMRLPVRLSFETHWFGDATMYLTGVGLGDDVKMARGQ